MKIYTRRKKERQLIPYRGTFRRELTLYQAIALLTPIGAGVLGIPYAIAQVGLFTGILYIIVIGSLMLALNLLIADVAIRTKTNLQLVGLAKKYLGRTGEVLMTGLAYSMLLGALVVYIIGIGESLSTILPGSSFFWSITWYVVGTVLIGVGLQTIKKIQVFLIVGIILVVGLIAGMSIPHIQAQHILYGNMASLLLPYGVMLFAFHGATAIPETHSLLKKHPRRFQQAIIYTTVITMCIYIVFSIAVVGVSGIQTTQIATVGLGYALGNSVLLLGNIFAVLAMGTSFLMVGISLRDSFVWDYRMPRIIATSLVCIIPISIFLLGLRGFISAIDIVGGVFGSLELVLLALICYKARKKGDIMIGSYHLRHTARIVAVLLILFTVGTIISLHKLL